MVAAAHAHAWSMRWSWPKYRSTTAGDAVCVPTVGLRHILVPLALRPMHHADSEAHALELKPLAPADLHFHDSRMRERLSRTDERL